MTTTTAPTLKSKPIKAKVCHKNSQGAKRMTCLCMAAKLSVQRPMTVKWMAILYLERKLSVQQVMALFEVNGCCLEFLKIMASLASAILQQKVINNNNNKTNTAPSIARKRSIQQVLGEDQAPTTARTKVDR